MKEESMREPVLDQLRALWRGASAFQIKLSVEDKSERKHRFLKEAVDSDVNDHDVFDDYGYQFSLDLFNEAGRLTLLAVAWRQCVWNGRPGNISAQDVRRCATMLMRWRHDSMAKQRDDGEVGDEDDDRTTN